MQSETEVFGDCNPRSPWCARPVHVVLRAVAALFQSTLPVWGATFVVIVLTSKNFNFNPRSPCGERPDAPETVRFVRSISIHAPRVGSDCIYPL